MNGDVGMKIVERVVATHDCASNLDRITRNLEGLHMIVPVYTCYIVLLPKTTSCSHLVHPYITIQDTLSSVSLSYSLPYRSITKKPH